MDAVARAAVVGAESTSDFKRIELEPWMQILPQIAFWIFFGVFLLVVARVIFMSRGQLRYMESLPLDHERPRHER